MPGIKYYLYSILIGCLFACHSDETLSKKDGEIIVDEVKATLKQYHHDIQAEGVLAELKYLDSTDQFSWMAPGFNTALSYDSVVSILKIMEPLYSKIEHSWDSLAVFPKTKIEASYTGTITSIMTSIHGLSDTLKLKEEGVVIKRKEGWKLRSGKTRVIH